jgi:DNA-binding transcriptional LysR family regulator
MSNIPTDLLRTLVTVVDQRSFTQAARTLGVTQPAVSAHIKRLQAILGADLFDRSGPGVSLTPKGELIVNHARRLLSINDLILHVAEPSPSVRTIRVGVPTDFLGANLPGLLATYRNRWPDLRFSVQNGGLELHLAELRHEQLDMRPSRTWRRATTGLNRPFGCAAGRHGSTRRPRFPSCRFAKIASITGQR